MYNYVHVYSEAIHPLDDKRKWFPLFDSVHILNVYKKQLDYRKVTETII